MRSHKVSLGHARAGSIIAGSCPTLACSSHPDPHTGAQSQGVYQLYTRRACPTSGPPEWEMGNSTDTRPWGCTCEATGSHRVKCDRFAVSPRSQSPVGAPHGILGWRSVLGDFGGGNRWPLQQVARAAMILPHLGSAQSCGGWVTAVGPAGPAGPVGQVLAIQGGRQSKQHLPPPPLVTRKLIENNK